MKNKSGFSLVEIMVSMGIMGLMITYMMQMQTNNQRQFRAISEQMDEINFLRRITQLVETENTCTATFGSYCQKTDQSQSSYIFHPGDCSDAGRSWLANSTIARNPARLEGSDLISLQEDLRFLALKSNSGVPAIYNKEGNIVMRGCRDALDPIRMGLANGSGRMLDKMANDFYGNLMRNGDYCKEGKFGDNIYLHRLIILKDPNITNSWDIVNGDQYEKDGNIFQKRRSSNPDIGQVHVVVEYFQKTFDKKAYNVPGLMKREIISLNAQTFKINPGFDRMQNVRISRCGAGVNTFQQPLDILVGPAIGGGRGGGPDCAEGEYLVGEECLRVELPGHVRALIEEEEEENVGIDRDLRDVALRDGGVRRTVQLRCGTGEIVINNVCVPMRELGQNTIDQISFCDICPRGSIQVGDNFVRVTELEDNVISRIDFSVENMTEEDFRLSLGRFEDNLVDDGGALRGRFDPTTGLESASRDAITRGAVDGIESRISPGVDRAAASGVDSGVRSAVSGANSGARSAASGVARGARNAAATGARNAAATGARNAAASGARNAAASGARNAAASGARNAAASGARNAAASGARNAAASGAARNAASGAARNAGAAAGRVGAGAARLAR